MKRETSKDVKISDSEWLVMKVLWTRSPRQAAEIIEALGPESDWNHRTIRTLLARLVKKGALRYEQAERGYLYHANLDEKACVHAEARSFVKRFYGGAVKPLLAAFIENEKLTKDEIEELKRLLEKRKGD